MGLFDAGNILDDLLDASESYFLLRQESDGHTEIVNNIVGLPAICHSLDEAREIARKYLAERIDKDLEIRVRRVSSSPVIRIRNEYKTYIAEPTAVDGVESVVSSYRVPAATIKEYKALIGRSQSFEDKPFLQATVLSHDLMTEFKEELRRIQEQFPEYRNFGIHFGDPTIVYMARSGKELDQILGGLDQEGKLLEQLVYEIER